MKIFFYEVQDYEREYIERYASRYGFEADVTDELLSLENAEKAEGCDAVSVLGFSRADGEMMRFLAKKGVNYFCTRTVGYEHIDVAAAKRERMTVLHAHYNSTNVADFTAMLILMMIRKCKVSVIRALVNNFSLDEIMGRDLNGMTVGVVGTGNIGRQVLKNLSGFGCRLLCYDKKESEEAKRYAEYRTFEDILTECDVISLHLPLTDESYHIIDKSALNRTKNGVILINTARGPLIDTEALIHALESGKVGGAALDTVEGEEGVCHVDIKTRIVNKQNLLYLKQFPNVVYTPHIGFFTEEAVAGMVEGTFLGILLSERGEKANPYFVGARL